MQRCLALSFILLILLLAAGCGSGKKAASSHTNSTNNNVAYRTPPKPAEPAQGLSEDSNAGDAYKLAAPLNEFGLALLSQEAQANSEGNIVISPASIQDALTMTLNGATDETATQMQKALSLDGLSLQQADQSWADLISFAQRRTDAQIRIANSLWLGHGISFEPAFLNTNRDYFAGDARVMPDDAEAAAVQINDWVDQRTGGRIKQLVGQVDPKTGLVLVNATYVKAGWDYFKIADTHDGPFTLADGKRVQVPMMHGKSFWADVTQTPAYLALPLTANGQVTVTIVLPRAGQTPESILPLLAHGELDTLSASTKSPDYNYIVDLTLPRFHASFTDGSLKTALQELGMTRAFSPQAQFQGITSSPLWISQVVHKATLDLNEQGVEAAAGTAVIMLADQPQPPTKHLDVHVDHPFIVVLSEGESGAPLFMAIVRDPTR